MVNKYSLGGIVLSIFLMAIWGVRRAVTWTPDSAAQTLPEGSTVSNSSQPDDSFISQAEGTADPNAALSPVEEAGTYIQRQQGLGEDGTVAGTPVNIIAVNEDSATSAQNDTTVDPQPTAPESEPTTAPAPPASTPTAVPALW